MVFRHSIDGVLTKRNPTPPPPPPPGWSIATTVRLDGHPVLEPGVELTITRPGRHAIRCRFVRQVATDTGREWLDVFDGKAVRSFPVDRVREVHRSRRMLDRGGA